MPHGIEERLAHIVSGTVEDERIGVVLRNQFIDGIGISFGEDLITEVAQ